MEVDECVAVSARIILSTTLRHDLKFKREKKMKILKVNLKVFELNEAKILSFYRKSSGKKSVKSFRNLFCSLKNVLN
jgi:hypothetical protein